MYARVTVTQIKPDMIDEAIRIMRESVMPAAQAQKGFKGVYMLTDRQANTSQTISLWETEADLQASEASGYYQEQIAKIGSVITAPPTRNLFEVSVQG